MIAIDLNADLGEGCPWDEELLDLVTTASISCGAHAGDDREIVRTLRAARLRGVAVGAHPGYPDREGFGRREGAMSGEKIATMVTEQVAHLGRLAEAEGIRLEFIKPHGALYNQAQRDPDMARGLVDAAISTGLPLFGLPDSEVAKAASREGVEYVAEGFADRGYRDDGTLIPRGETGALLDDPGEIGDQVVRLVRSGRIRTLCIHGDSPHAVPLARIVRETLDRRGIATRSFRAWV